MQENDTIKRIDAHAAEFGLKVTTIGQMAVRSRNAYDRIKEGTAHLNTERRVLAWLDQDRAARQKAGAA